MLVLSCQVYPKPNPLRERRRSTTLSGWQHTTTHTSVKNPAQFLHPGHVHRDSA